MRHPNRVSRIFAYVIGLVLVLMACQPTATVLSGRLPIHAPNVITAGMALTVTVGPVEATDGTRIGLVMIGRHGPYIYHTTFHSGIAEFHIPGEHTRQAGMMAFVAAAEDARGEASLLLRPDPNPRSRASLPEWRYF